MSQVKMAERRNRRGLWPLLGLFLAVAAGAIAFLLAPLLIEFLQTQNRRFGVGMEPERLRLYVTIGITFVFLSIAALIVALAAPKKAINVKETDLIKERARAQMRHKYEVKRQRKINREMREDVKARTEVNRNRFDDK